MRCLLGNVLANYVPPSRAPYLLQRPPLFTAVLFSTALFAPFDPSQERHEIRRFYTSSSLFRIAASRVKKISEEILVRNPTKKLVR